MNCPECGLSFPRGVRQFSTWGKSRVTLEQHRDFHEQERESRSKPRDPFISYGYGYPIRWKPAPGVKVHFLVHTPDSSFTIPTLKPTLEELLLRHARKFGVEGVYETAEPLFGEKALKRLRIELDAIEADRKSGGFTVGRRRRRSEDETRQAVLSLSVDGLVPAAIADKLGLSDATVSRHLRKTGATALT